MNSKFIQDAVQKWLYERSHIYQACNYNRSGYMEADILAITKSLMVTEVEVKISLSDYKADFKKTHKHKLLSERDSKSSSYIPNKFYYACPSGLIKEVPDYAGLIWVGQNGDVEWIKTAPRLHKDKASDKLMIGMLENLTAKTIFGCQYMTYQAKLSKEAHKAYEQEMESERAKYKAV